MIKFNVFVTISLLLWLCAGLLLLLTIILYSLNRNQEVTAKLVTGIVVGALTFLSTVYFSLKSSQIEDSFVCWVIIHKDSKKPAMLPQENESDEIRAYMVSLSQIGNSVDLKDKLPKNDEEQFVILAEILQCKFIEDIAMAQRKGRSLRVSATDKGLFTKGSINQPVKFSDAEKVIGESLLLNRFSKGISLFKDKGTIPLPKNSTVSLEYTPTTPENLGNHSIYLEKPNYFRAEISIQSLGSTDLSILQTTPASFPKDKGPT